VDPFWTSPGPIKRTLRFTSLHARAGRVKGKLGIRDETPGGSRPGAKRTLIQNPGRDE